MRDRGAIFGRLGEAVVRCHPLLHGLYQVIRFSNDSPQVTYSTGVVPTWLRGTCREWSVRKSDAVEKYCRVFVFLDLICQTCPSIV